jgi:imidazoleglycerol-phosphate dehydratase/histidinol-phosphatase
MMRIFEGEGITFAEVLICPHRAGDGCACRKPRAGLLDDYLARAPIDAGRSFVVGDRLTDVELGRVIGLRTILLDRAGSTTSGPDHIARTFREACDLIIGAGRSARLQRRTSETSITVTVAVEGTGRHAIDTGIGFFDHMLAQLARHSMIDMTIEVEGDLEVDEHHTVEDTGLALGEAIRTALGDKRGIERYGFLLPMDEALAEIAIDLGGRPFLVFDAIFRREYVGGLPTEMVEDFFRAFSDGLRAGLHIAVRGRNDHHRIEAIFKGVARALRSAVARTPHGIDLIPSTKGVL